MKTLRQAQDRLIRYIFLLVLVLAGGCTQNRVPTAPAPAPGQQAQATFRTVRPKADDIIEFKADLVPARGHFKDFKVERNDIEEVLRTWYQVSQEHWRHGYSHVALEDRTGTIKLKDGTTIRWMVRPGGLAKLTFKDGTALYLARELTAWKKNVQRMAHEAEKMEVAYTFLLKKVQEDNVNLIAAKDDKNLDLIQKIIHTNKLNLEVENYSDVKEGPDLCYYSKCTKETVAIIDVTERDEKNYYVSYYIGPEGGASKEILIEKRGGKWTVVNDDGMWSVK